jgi:hypothetical protein
MILIMRVYKAIDFIQWVWKQVWNIDYSRSKIRQDIRQGAVKINNYKIKETDIFTFDDEQ